MHICLGRFINCICALRLGASFALSDFSANLGRRMPDFLHLFVRICYENTNKALFYLAFGELETKEMVEYESSNL